MNSKDNSARKNKAPMFIGKNHLGEMEYTLHDFVDLLLVLQSQGCRCTLRSRWNNESSILPKHPALLEFELRRCSQGGTVEVTSYFGHSGIYICKK